MVYMEKQMPKMTKVPKMPKIKASLTRRVRCVLLRLLIIK
jgi:hypothetical protein